MSSGWLHNKIVCVKAYTSVAEVLIEVESVNMYADHTQHSHCSRAVGSASVCECGSVDKYARQSSACMAGWCL